jgi:hypothetical protein
MIRRNRKLLLVHLMANALLLWLAYEWLGVDESSTARLLLSAVDALAILSLVCWLYGASMVWYQAEEPRLNESFRTALRHLGGLLALAIAGLAIYGLIAKAEAASAQPALKLASWLTWTFRKPVKPATVGTVFHAVFWLLRWGVLPVLLLRIAAGIATQGRKGWRTITVRRPWRHWVLVPLLALAGLWLPFVILNWRPKVANFTLEFASFGLRALVAYLLFVLVAQTLVFTASPLSRARAPQGAGPAS